MRLLFQPFKIKEYVDQNGQSPFREWLDSLDITIRARIQVRILRIETGNLGDYKSVGSGIMELRFNFGPGYRVYFGKEKDALIILLLGGDKNSQNKDIKKAQKFLDEYLKEGKKK